MSLTADGNLPSRVLNKIPMLCCKILENRYDGLSTDRLLPVHKTLFSTIVNSDGQKYVYRMFLKTRIHGIPKSAARTLNVTRNSILSGGGIKGGAWVL